tara:strand:+ start:879 stop:1514 length:636 start_codon:yes stop_codon:yes gene_type:complete
MATRPGIDTNASLRLENDHQNLVFALKLDFDTETILLHTGVGDLEIDGDTYLGAGSLLSISDIEDGSDLKSAGVTFSISGMNTDVLGYALTENYQNRIATLKMAFLSGGTDHVQGVMDVYTGRMMQINISDSAQQGATVTLQTENRLIDMRRPSNYRYTKESQNYLYPNDTSLDEVAKIQDMELLWGRKQGGSSGGGGRGNEEDGTNTQRS